ncbi:MAG: family N-acetyltransferase [Aeromicrobium sp.]|nr:family N-acetyltransferase [Aeromicrobium sp.]
MTLDAVAIGSRIVVRHETGGIGPTGGPEMTDVVGHVRGVDDASVRVELRDGSTRVVDRSSIVTWKPVPPRPLRRRRARSVDAEELTRITSRGWPAAESAPLGDWELRAAGRFTGRANSVAVTGSPGMPFDEATARVREFYAVRSLPALAQVVVGSGHDRRFADAGWEPMSGYHGGAVVQVADLESAYPADPEARIAPVADDDWLASYGRVDDPVIARRVMEAPDRVGFVSIGSPAVAIGRVVLIGEWAGLSAVEVRPEARRQGLARRVVETSLSWAVGHGADKAYLQTMRSNTAALALYAPFGFADHHDYLYRQAAAPHAHHPHRPQR